MKEIIPETAAISNFALYQVPNGYKMKFYFECEWGGNSFEAEGRTTAECIENISLFIKQWFLRTGTLLPYGWIKDNINSVYKALSELNT